MTGPRRGGRTRRALPGVRAVLVALVAAGTVGLALAPSAQAHARVRSTVPAAGATLTTAPQEVVLTFNEPPIGVGAVVRVEAPDGRVVSVGAVRVVDDEVHQTLADGLARGAYHVAWRVTSDDGHPVSDEFAFTVAGDGAASSSSASSAPSTTSATPGAAPTVATTRPTPPEATSGTASRWLVLAAALVAVALGVLALARTRSTRHLRK
ncbi:copper resistance CopC family protein [Pedococcus soli]